MKLLYILPAAAMVVMLWFTSIDPFRHRDNRQIAARRQIDNFLAALRMYYGDHGSYPTTAEGLPALRPYFQKDIPFDPWGREYIYRFPGAHGAEPDVISYGADGKPGGTGLNVDVTSWK